MLFKNGKSLEARLLAEGIDGVHRTTFSAYPSDSLAGNRIQQKTPLAGLRIALDPGHTAGVMESGKVEQKFIDIPADSLKQTPEIKLIEGHLTLCTALFLKKQLEDAGAIVFMTHSQPDGTALGKTFEQWLKADLSHTLDSLVACKKITREKKVFYKTKASKRTVFFDIFKDIELKKRAEIINAFHPSLTIIIHYNVDEKNTDWKKLSDKNFTMAFIGGAMLPSNLNKSENRFDFLRMALTDDLDNSEKLSDKVVHSFSKNLRIPIATENDASYLKENCLSTPSQGVFCRNLVLTRLLSGPLVYGETLYQDNKQEALSLTREDVQIDGLNTSSRIKDVADAYFQGILDYFKY
jgi:N-acetylmuramoyl-L-alanine amidase